MLRGRRKVHIVDGQEVKVDLYIVRGVGRGLRGMIVAGPSKVLRMIENEPYL